MSARKEGNRPDPIFALIAAHAKAARASTRAEDSLYRLKRRLDARQTEKQKHSEQRLTCAWPYFDIGSRCNPVAVITSREKIATHVSSVFDQVTGNLGSRSAARVRAHERGAVAELERRYDDFLRAHRRARKACGLIAREKAAEDAHYVAAQALTALLKIAPAAPAGRLALAKHLSGVRDGQAPQWALRAGLERLSEPLQQ